jgi:transmembrane sensor
LLTESQIQKEAIDWFVQLRADNSTNKDQAEFAAWLILSESHQAAFNKVKLRWQSMDVLKKDDIPVPVTRTVSNRAQRPTLVRWGFATAAMLAIVTVAMWLTFDTNQIYTTAMGEQQRVLLADGSSVHLNTNTMIKVIMSGDQRKIILEKGEVLCDVAENPERPFTVIAGETEVVALGTRFSVYLAPEKTLITVVEGRVSVTPNSLRINDGPYRQMVVNPGEQAIVSSNPSIAQSSVPIARPIIFREWDKGLLVFDQTPLDEVVNEIARYFPGKLQLGSDVPDQLVTGTFKLRDRSVLLETLSKSYSLKVVELDDKTLLVSQKVTP